MRVGLFALLCVSLAQPAFTQTPVQLFGRDETTGQLRAVTTDATGQVNTTASVSVGSVGIVDSGMDNVSDDATNSINVRIAADAVGIGGGVQYTEAATDASITGTALLFEGAADTLIAAPGTAADGLLVNLGTNNDVTVTGTVTANLSATDNAVLDDIADGITVTANAGTNLNTSALALEAGGNLAAAATSLGTLDNIVSGAGINITQWVGAAPGATNPLPVRIADGSTFVALSSDATHGTTTYTEATTAGPVIGVVRNDTLDSLANTTNEIAPLAVDANGALWARFADPCSGPGKAYFPVDIVTATTTEIVNASASNYIYICSINLVTAGANNVTIVEDDTDACASPTAGIFGGVTAAEGWNFAANGGLTLGSGNGSVGRSGTVNRYICFITSAAVQLSGQVVYVLAP